MTLRKCVVCDKEFIVYPYNEKTHVYCSTKCNLSVLSEKLKKRTFIKCVICGKEVWQTPSHPRITCSYECARKQHSKIMFGRPSPNKGKKLSLETKKKISESQKGKRTGENNSSWKGNKVGYYALHAWINKSFGTPDTCEICGKTGLTGRDINWANKDGTYQRNRDNWLRLCASCHKKHDKSWLNYRLSSKNTSGYRGVSFIKGRNKWRATIKKKEIGKFLSKIEAAKAYDKEALKLWGKQAPLNFKQ